MSDKNAVTVVEEQVDFRAKLDLASLERKASYMPEGTRESFIWLGTYCRTECNADFRILHAQFLELQIDHAATTWSKILRGMYQRDATGVATKAPVISEHKFLEAVRALKSFAATQARGGGVGFVMTPTAQGIFDYINAKRSAGRVNKFGMIIGETGTQKTATTMEFTRLNAPFAVHMESPYKPSANQFVMDLAGCYGFNDQEAYKRKEIYLMDTVKSGGVIIIENVQRMYDPSQEENQAGFSFIQRLQEKTKCCVILTLTPVAEKKLLYGAQRAFFEQFVGRCGGFKRGLLRLPAYPTRDDVLAIAEAYGLQKASEHVDFLAKLAKQDGRVRTFFEYLQDGKIAAEQAKRPLTIGLLRELAEDDAE